MQGNTRLDMERKGKLRHGKARSRSRYGKERQGNEIHGKERKGMERNDMARKGQVIWIYEQIELTNRINTKKTKIRRTITYIQ
jgi:hypothetical protein